MNDLMTKSLYNYVELKKQAMKDIIEAEEAYDLEIGQFDPSDDLEKDLSDFFQDVTLIKNDMQEITNLLLGLQDLKQELVNTTHSTKVLRDRISSDMVAMLRIARNIKSRLESLEESNIENRNISIENREGSYIDRTRMSVTNGLRIKLREMMIDFQSLRQQIVEDHEGFKKSYNVTGEEPTGEIIEKMVIGGGELEDVFEGKAELAMENSESQEALEEMQRSLTELNHLFLDMAVLVETQEELINDIENNITQGGIHVNGGTNELFYANQMVKRRGKWGYWIGGLVLILLLVWIICILTLEIL